MPTNWDTLLSLNLLKSNLTHDNVAVSSETQLDNAQTLAQSTGSTTTDIEVRSNSSTFLKQSYSPLPVPSFKTPSYIDTHTKFPTITVSQAVQCGGGDELSTSSSNPSPPSSETDASSECSEYELPTASELSMEHSDISPTTFPHNEEATHYPFASEAGLSEGNFQPIWDSPIVDLTGRLVLRDPQNPTMIGHVENEIAGIPVRLILDHHHCADLTPFHWGTVINFLGISTFQCHYLIEDCPQVCNNIVYFKVVCYTQDQQSFPAYDQERPAFILAAPSYLAPFPNISNNLSPPLRLPANPYPTLDDECHDVLLGIRERCWQFLGSICSCF